jgi:DNA-binding transcriptional LysR family regulator
MHELDDINLNRLVVFVAVVEAGSLAGAARQLGLAKAMVTTHIQKLEAELRASLLVRTTRRLSLTEAGAAFHAAAQRIVQLAEDAVASARHHGGQVQGSLRITSPVDYAAVVAPVAAALMRAHPGLRVELLTADGVLDLVASGIDLGLRVGWLADSSHQATRVGSFRQWLLASPALLAGHAPPTHPGDLAQRPMLALSVLKQPRQWTFTGPQQQSVELRFEPVFLTDSAVAMRQALLAGIGFGVLTDFAAADDVAAGRLVPVLPGWTLPDGGVHAVFPATPQRALKVKAFVEALRAHLNRSSS